MAKVPRKSGNSRPTAPATVVEQLRGDILAGRLSDGERLTEANLAQRFGVGRGPVREAMRDLAAQGLVLSRPNRGAVVAPEAPRPVREVINPIRQTIESYALASIFEDLTADDFLLWNELLDKMKEACVQMDYLAIAELDLAFHRSLLERAGQPDLLMIWDVIVGRIRTHFRKTQRRCPNPMVIYDEHRAIVDCMQNGTLIEAQRLLREGIE